MGWLVSDWVSMRKISFWLFTLLALAGCRPAEPKLQGIVLVISDGTSQELITATRIYAKGAEGHLQLESFPQAAIVRTRSASHIVTDSGAGATAMARGIKADNRVVGQADPTSTTAPPSLLDVAKQAGWSTGVVTDDAVTGATPAAFLVEHGQRDEASYIAKKTASHLGSRADIVLGGGSQWFSDRTSDPAVVYDDAAQKAVARETAEILSRENVAVFDKWDAFMNRQDDGRPILGTFYPKEFPYIADGDRAPRLRAMVEEAVKTLKNKGKPFLLIVEAGLPDKACHLNSAKRAMEEVLELDSTLAWLQTLPNVLTLVTTDHNTGGLVLNGYPPSPYRGDALLRPDPVTGRFYLTWSSGPGFDREVATIRTRIVREPGKPLREVKETKDPTDPDYLQPALIDAPKGSLHTGGDVWLLGTGPGSDKIRGYMENTDIYGVIIDAIKGKTGTQRK